MQVCINLVVLEKHFGRLKNVSSKFTDSKVPKKEGLSSAFYLLHIDDARVF